MIAKRFGFNTGTNTALYFALLSATLMIAQQVGGKSTRDALFLSHFDVTQLPKVVIAAALLSLVAVILMSRLLARHGPVLLVPLVFSFSAFLFVLEWFLYATHPDWVAILLYLHMAVFGAILISGFWSVINERFDPHTAKKTIARIAAAATLGGVLGGLITKYVADVIDLQAMLLVLGGLHLLCVFGVLGIGHNHHPDSHDSGKLLSKSGTRIFLETPYLQQMAVLMILIAIIAALVDYIFKAEASARFQSKEDLVAFFASFYAGIGVITFLIQTALGPRTLQRFGLGITIGVLPVLLVFFGAISSIISGLISVVLLRGSHSIFYNSFFRSSFELLYTPLPPNKKRPTKTIIDVASDRSGDMIGGGLILLMLALMPELPSAVVAISATLLALMVLYVVSSIYRGYISQLAGNLRDTTILPSDIEVLDATTRQILAETNVQSERRLLLDKIKQQKKEKHSTENIETNPVDDIPEASAHETSSRLTPDDQSEEQAKAVANLIADLSSDDADRIEKALWGEQFNHRYAVYIIPLLANDDVAEDVRTVLRWMVPNITGQLTDGLLDPELSLLARQRLPGVMEVSHNARVVDALLLGIEEPEFNIRYSCSRALARMTERDTDLFIPEQKIYHAVLTEVTIDQDVWDERTLDNKSGEAMELTASGNQSMANPSLDYVFTLLSLIHDRHALRLASFAVTSTDRNMRGTALEYLDNILPENIKKHLWPRLGAHKPVRHSSRTQLDIVKELNKLADNKEK